MPSPFLAIMAKAPSCGDPKTRLQPPLTAAQARALARAFLEDTAATARLCGAEVHLACTPAAGRTEVEQLSGLPPQRIFVQQGEGLSTRCAHAFHTLFSQGADAAVLIGADTPHLPLACLQEAISALASTDAARLVLGPSDDGGYYLIGLRREAVGALPLLLDGMEWSTTTVFAATLDRAAQAGLEVVTLPACYDIDTLADLLRLKFELARHAADGAAPRTRALLEQLSL